MNELPCPESENTKNSSNTNELCNNETNMISSELTKIKRKKFVLGDHINVIEGTPIAYFCTICKHKFKWKRQGAYHEYCSTGKRPLQCKFCPKRFVTNSHLQYHLLTHTGEVPFKCAYCNRAYKQKDKLKRHERIHKDGSSESNRCPICKKLLSAPSSLKLHLLTHRTERPFKCKQCKLGYTNEYDYKRHLSKHSGISNFVCEQCGKSFPRKFNLNAHYVIHSGLRPFECSICNCAFKKKYELTRHIKQHEKVVMFECTVCLTKFSRKDNLLRHARNTHPGVKVSLKVSNSEPKNVIIENIDEAVQVRKSVIVTASLSTGQLPNNQMSRAPVIHLAPSSNKQLINLQL